MYELNPPVKEKKVKSQKAPKAAKTPKEPKDLSTKGSNAPRPRKHDYGIVDDAQVVRAMDEPSASLRKGVAGAWVHTDGNPTVAAFYEKGGNRHDLRVLSRKGLVKIVHTNGDVYPKEYAGEPAAAEAA